MKGQKEYPATHSMSTAWYAADEEGNVAIIDYNDNGPVPWETEQTTIEDLVLGHEEEFGKFIRINLTKEQIFELLEDSHRSYVYYSVIQIDSAQQQSFMKKMKDAQIFCALISEEEGLFLIDGYDLENAFPEMMQNKRIYDIKEYDIDEACKDGKIVFKCNFQSVPYFIYAQPYNPDFLTERLNIPDNPVKLDQFPEPFRQRVPRLPVRFRDTPKLQIAEWIPCSFSYGEPKHLNGCEYGLLPKPDGQEVYALSTIDDIDFFPYCSEKEKHHCTACIFDHYDRTCPNTTSSTFTHKPTVMMIVSPLRKKDYKYNTCTDIITLHSIILPYLPKIPKPLKGLFFSEEIKDEVSQLETDEYLKKCRRYLDDMVARYRPRVIIIGEDAYKGLSNVYAMDKTSIEIGDERYPFYRENDIETHRKEIERLAMLPYRGTEFPIVISKEEMERIGKGRYD